jgi:hypothetical protein
MGFRISCAIEAESCSSERACFPSSARRSGESGEAAARSSSRATQRLLRMGARTAKNPCVARRMPHAMAVTAADIAPPTRRTSATTSEKTM